MMGAYHPAPQAGIPGVRDTMAYPTAGERYGVAPPPPGAVAAAAGGLHIPGASSLYTLLGVLLMAGGVLALIMPYKLTDWFFRGHPYGDVLYEELWRLLGAALLAGAITCYALKVGADRGILNDAGVQRLQMALFWWAALSVLLHLVHLLATKTLTLWGLLLGAILMAPTLLLPSAHLGMSGGFGLTPMMEGVSACLGNLFAPRRLTFMVLLYSLLTILFTVAGLICLIVPRPSMSWTFGYNLGHPSSFLWQWVGGALLFLFPAMTYTCQERAIAGRLWTEVPRVLNVGLLVAALMNVLDLGTVLVGEGVSGRWMLPTLFGHWVLTLVAAVAGLATAPPEAPAVAYEYEPLTAETASV